MLPPVYNGEQFLRGFVVAGGEGAEARELAEEVFHPPARLAGVPAYRV